MKKKVLQVPVVVGKGSAQFFIEKDTTISPPSPPIFKIEDIQKKVMITETHVIPGKVIFNAILWKNVIYKTVEDVCDGVVNGPVFHATFKVPFSGFVEIEPIGCEKVKEDDVAELLEAEVEGEKNFLHGETCIKGVKVFEKLLEKDVVRITFKVIRQEHVPVVCEDEKDDRKDKDDCKKDKDDDKKEKRFDIFDDKKDDKKDWREEKFEDKFEEKRYDCRGDYYARCRGFYK